MKIKWLLAHYGFGPEHPHIAVPEGARKKLGLLSDELDGTDDLLGIYIPEGTADVYDVGPMRGRIVGAVRLLPMPVDRRPEDYFYRDLLQTENETARWPFGWPCRVVLAVPVEKVETTRLRSMVAYAHPGSTFGTYAAQFQQGPVKLGPPMRREVTREMVRLFGEPPWADGTCNPQLRQR